MGYYHKRGLAEDFHIGMLHPGEMALITDAKELVFCFGENQVERLKFGEDVDKKTAETLISKIIEFAENSARNTARRFGR